MAGLIVEAAEQAAKKLAKKLSTSDLNNLSVDELVKLGYPNEVAVRIASGDLPMDAASLAARRDEFGKPMFRGIGETYKEGGSNKASLWATDDPDFAMGYAKENAIKSDAPAANVMPVRVKSKNPINFGFRTSMTEVRPDEMANRVGTRIQEALDAGKITKDQAIKADDAIWDWYESLSDKHKNSSNFVYSYWNNDKDFVEALRKAGFDSIDDAEFSDFNWTSKPDVKTVGAIDNNMRSEFAAFDPEYKGSNMMGAQAAAGIGTGLLTGILTGAASTYSPESKAGTTSQLMKLAKSDQPKQWQKMVEEYSADIKDSDELAFMTLEHLTRQLDDVRSPKDKLDIARRILAFKQAGVTFLMS